MLQTYYYVLAVTILATVSVGLIRVLRGPTAADRMVAALLFGASGVAVLMLLAEASRVRFLHDVALVFALLAAVTAVTFVRRVWRVVEDPNRPNES